MLEAALGLSDELVVGGDDAQAQIEGLVEAGRLVDRLPVPLVIECGPVLGRRGPLAISVQEASVVGRWWS